MDKLLPCPFCGGEAHMVRWASGMKYCRVECKNTDSCDCHGIQFRTEEESIAAWNRRAQPENKPCADCAGIVYRQTNSGKVVPVGEYCVGKFESPAPGEQWVEAACDNTNYVLTCADELYCVTDAKGRVVCEFMHSEKEASNER